MVTVKIAEQQIFKVVSVKTDSAIIEHQEIKLELTKTEMTKTLEVGEMIEAFVYIDHNKRLAATMRKPLIDTYKPGLVEVVEVKPGLGVFVNIGLAKDILVSFDELPVTRKTWPQNKDKLFCILRAGKNQIVAKLISRFKMSEYFIPEGEFNVGDQVLAYVFSVAEEGIVFFTASGHEIFIYYKHVRKDYRLGESATITIQLKKDKTHYNGTLIESKELMIDKDAESILDYLRNNQGLMPYTDKTESDIIFKQFKMSKSAFKRALGLLYKERYVILSPNETILAKKD